MTNESVDIQMMTTRPEALRRRFSGTDPLRIVLEARTRLISYARGCGLVLPGTGHRRNQGGRTFRTLYPPSTARAATNPDAEACTNPRVTPAPSPTA